MKRRFEGKTALVTGAGTGMGRAAALRLAQEGATVVLWGRRASPLQEVADEIADVGGSALVQNCDIAQPSQIAKHLDLVVKKFGALDAVFANAGHLGAFKPARETQAGDFTDLVEINLVGTQQTVAQSLARMEGGAVVINASWTANAVMPGTGAYAATKAGLTALMRVLAVEEGPRGNRINSISPGVILSPMAEEVLDPDLAKKLADHTPLRRNGRPEDISSAVAWLLSDEAAFVTGQDIVLDGGFTLGGVLR